ncbi:MAG: glucose-6-phosphate isomerase, partial [Treponema sp.]|nr:glucose-6-phosphate isomerase [Treponema sp.]
MQYTNLDKTAAYQQLVDYASTWKGFDFRATLDAERVRQCQTKMAAGLGYSWAAKAVDTKALGLLQALADEQGLVAKYKALLDGEVINTGEKRKVLHQLSRGEQGRPVIENGKNIGEFYRGELARFCDFADGVHQGKFKGSTGKDFTAVVQIGIGGSDLGPRALYLALENWAAKEGR